VAYLFQVIFLYTFGFFLTGCRVIGIGATDGKLPDDSTI